MTQPIRSQRSSSKRAAARPRTTPRLEALERALVASALVSRLERELVRAVELLTKIGHLHDSLETSKARLELRVDELEARHAALAQIEHRAGQPTQTTKLH